MTFLRLVRGAVLISARGGRRRGRWSRCTFDLEALADLRGVRACGALPVVIVLQGRQRVQGRRRRSRQRCAAPWRLEWPTRTARRPSGGDQAFSCACRRLVAGALGFPAAHRLSSGAGEGALSAVGEIDGDGVLGDVDGHDGVGVAVPFGEEPAAGRQIPLLRHANIDDLAELFDRTVTDPLVGAGSGMPRRSQRGEPLQGA